MKMKSNLLMANAKKSSRGSSLADDRLQSVFPDNEDVEFPMAELYISDLLGSKVDNNRKSKNTRNGVQMKGSESSSKALIDMLEQQNFKQSRNSVTRVPAYTVQDVVAQHQTKVKELKREELTGMKPSRNESKRILHTDKTKSMYGLSDSEINRKSFVLDDSINSKPSKKSSVVQDMLSNAIVDLYMNLKNKTVRSEINYLTESDFKNSQDEEKKKLMDLGNICLINYIRSFFDILCQQLETSKKSQTPSASVNYYHETGSQKPSYEEHEKLIQQLEADIRVHISQHQQFKLHIEGMEQLIDDLNRETQKLSDENTHFIDKIAECQHFVKEADTIVQETKEKCQQAIDEEQQKYDLNLIEVQAKMDYNLIEEKAQFQQNFNDKQNKLKQRLQSITEEKDTEIEKLKKILIELNEKLETAEKERVEIIEKKTDPYKLEKIKLPVQVTQSRTKKDIHYRSYSQNELPKGNYNTRNSAAAGGSLPQPSSQEQLNRKIQKMANNKNVEFRPSDIGNRSINLEVIPQVLANSSEKPQVSFSAEKQVDHRKNRNLSSQHNSQVRGALKTSGVSMTQSTEGDENPNRTTFTNFRQFNYRNAGRRNNNLQSQKVLKTVNGVLEANQVQKTIQLIQKSKKKRIPQGQIMGMAGISKNMNITAGQQAAISQCLRLKESSGLIKTADRRQTVKSTDSHKPIRASTAIRSRNQNRSASTGQVNKTTDQATTNYFVYNNTFGNAQQNQNQANNPYRAQPNSQQNTIYAGHQSHYATSNNVLQVLKNQVPVLKDPTPYVVQNRMSSI